VDDAANTLVTAYAVTRPDGEWALLLVNKDATNAHSVHINFRDEAAKSLQHFTGTVAVTTFGAEQYAWHPLGSKSHADPDGPPAVSTLDADLAAEFNLPRASVTVFRGRIR
jgi:hypothetical protein